MERYLLKCGFKVLRRKQWHSHPGGKIFELDECPFDPSHTQGSAAFTVAEGTPGFSCKHNGCLGRTIKDVFCVYPPDQSTTISGGDREDKREGRESCATTLVKLSRASANCFHDGETCYAAVETQNHREIHVLKSSAFKRWLGRLYFETHQKAAGREAMASAILALEGHARFEGADCRVYVRLAHHDGKIYLDLCDERWRTVEIGKQAWRVIESKECPVNFRRAAGMLSLPAPEPNAKLSELRDLLNCPKDVFALLVAWLIGAFHPHGPYPVLILHGEQGSAKTTTARILRSLVDPNLSPVRSQPREPRDLMIAATNGMVCSFDNLSNLPDWFSDALCRLSTGGGFSTRSLYTDDEEVIFEAKRPVILNGIEELATRSDLLDRSMVVELPRIEDALRQPEDCLREKFERARPRLLGALLDAVSGALACVESTKLEKLPRMADFAVWVTAAEQVLSLDQELGWKCGDFLRIYDENRRAMNDLSLEDPVAEAIRQLDMPWHGRATDLLTELERLVDERTCRLKLWPGSPNALSNKLRRLAPNLRRSGIEVQFSRTGGKRYIDIVCIAAAPEAQPVRTSAECADRADEIPPLSVEGASRLQGEF